MSEPRIWINNAVESFITIEAARTWPLETGGVLIGYVADNDDMVILSASGPGPNASHKRYRFKPDHNYQLDFIEEAFINHNRKAYYLGDWHTHPKGEPAMSFMDRRTLIRIAEYKEVTVSAPLMLILGGGRDDQWEYCAHRFTAKSLLGMRDVAQPQKITIY